MSGELDDLYQQVVLDHGKNPRNFRKLEGACCRHADGFNPLCGDRVTVFVQLGEDDRVTDVSFVGQGCAICTASASMMTQMLIGRSVEEVDNLFHGFHELVTASPTQDATEDERLGKLAALAGVRRFPIRVKCATLPWHTLMAAIQNHKKAAGTE